GGHLVGPGDAAEPASALVGLDRRTPQRVRDFRHSADGIELLRRHVSQGVDDAARLRGSDAASPATRSTHGGAESKTRGGAIGSNGVDGSACLVVLRRRARAFGVYSGGNSSLGVVLGPGDVAQGVGCL